MNSKAIPFKLAARMLREYAERLSCDSCNDMEIEATPENLQMYLVAAAKAKPTPPDVKNGMFCANNAVVANALADLLEAEHDVVAASAFRDSLIGSKLKQGYHRDAGTYVDSRMRWCVIRESDGQEWWESEAPVECYAMLEIVCYDMLGDEETRTGMTPKEECDGPSE